MDLIAVDVVLREKSDLMCKSFLVMGISINMNGAEDHVIRSDFGYDFSSLQSVTPEVKPSSVAKVNKVIS